MSNLDIFTVRLPPALSVTDEDRRFFDYLNKYLHDLGVRTGGFGFFSDIPLTYLNSKLIELEKRVGSGQFATWDDDGFTWDTDEFTWDIEEF